jgi:hypothetical protein
MSDYSGFKRSSYNRIGLSLIILLGFAVRLYKLGEQSLWYDETVSAFLAGQAPLELIGHTARDIHPPAYYLLLHYWASLTGSSEFALAFFSVIFGVLLIALTARLADYLASRSVAIWAALLVALSPFNLWYSQEVRMYTLGATLGVIATLCGLQAIKAGRLKKTGQGYAWPYWLGYLGAAALGLYTLYYFAFLLLIINLFFLIKLWRADGGLARFKGFLGSNFLLLCLYLPWLPTAWRQVTEPPVPPWRDPPQLEAMLLESWTALNFGHSIEPIMVWPALPLSLALIGLGSRWLVSTTPRNYLSGPVRLALLLAYTFGALLLIGLISFATPLYHVRYLFTYSPAFYILLAAGLAWLARRTRLGVTLAALALLAGSLFSLYQMHFNPLYQADDYRAAVAFIEAHWQPGDVIVANAGYTYPAFLYYAELPGLERRRLVPYQIPDDQNRPLLLQTGTIDGSSQLGWGDPRSDFYAMPASDTTTALEHLGAHFPRLWLLRAYDTVTDPQGLIRAWLEAQAVPLEDQLFSGQSNIRAQGFLLSTPPPPTTSPIAFADHMVLAGWDLPTPNWQAGDTIHLKLWWQTTDTPLADYKISLKLWSPQGTLAAQGQDEWPVGALYRATDWPSGQVVYHPTQITLPPDLPPGQYWLNVELYHPETVQPLPRADNGEPFVTLGPVTIEATQ